MEINSLAALPEHLQIVLVSGYVGYITAYAGYRNKERKDELLYGILVFGLFGYIFYDFTRASYGHVFMPAVGAMLVSFLSAIFWRKYGRRLLCGLLHKAAISNEDGIKTVWERVIQDTTIYPTQLVVHLKDGSRLECDEVQAFSDAPIPRFYADNEGGIALYVNKRTAPDGSVKEMASVRDPDWGDRITYVPKEEIARIAVRFKGK